MVLGRMVQPGNDLQARMLLQVFFFFHTEIGRNELKKNSIRFQLNEFVKNPISSVVYCAKENKNLSETSNVDSKESVNNLKEKSGPAANVVQSAMEVSNAKGEQRNDVKGSDFDHVAVPTRSETDDGAVGLNHLAVPTPSEADDGAYPPPHPAQGIAGRKLNRFIELSL